MAHHYQHYPHHPHHSHHPHHPHHHDYDQPGLSGTSPMAHQTKDPLKPKISDSNMKKSQVSIDIEPLEIVARTVIKEDNIWKTDKLSFAIAKRKDPLTLSN